MYFFISHILRLTFCLPVLKALLAYPLPLPCPTVANPKYTNKLLQKKNLTFLSIICLSAFSL